MVSDADLISCSISVSMTNTLTINSIGQRRVYLAPSGGEVKAETQRGMNKHTPPAHTHFVFKYSSEPSPSNSATLIRMGDTHMKT